MASAAPRRAHTTSSGSPPGRSPRPTTPSPSGASTRCGSSSGRSRSTPWASAAARCAPSTPPSSLASPRLPPPAAGARGRTREARRDQPRLLPPLHLPLPRPPRPGHRRSQGGPLLPPRQRPRTRDAWRVLLEEGRPQKEGPGSGWPPPWAALSVELTTGVKQLLIGVDTW